MNPAPICYERGKKNSMRFLRTLLVLVSLLFLLVACGSGNNTQTPKASTTPTPAVTATPTPGVPAGTLLFQSDLSKGLKNWGTTHWSIVKGAAQSDLSK